jgi:hypothetical protein
MWLNAITERLQILPLALDPVNEVPRDVCRCVSWVPTKSPDISGTPLFGSMPAIMLLAPARRADICNWFTYAIALPRRLPRVSAAHSPTPRLARAQFCGMFLHPEVITHAYLESRAAQAAIMVST